MGWPEQSSPTRKGAWEKAWIRSVLVTLGASNYSRAASRTGLNRGEVQKLNHLYHLHRDICCIRDQPAVNARREKKQKWSSIGASQKEKWVKKTAWNYVKVFEKLVETQLGIGFGKWERTRKVFLSLCRRKYLFCEERLSRLGPTAAESASRYLCLTQIYTSSFSWWICRGAGLCLSLWTDSTNRRQSRWLLPLK